MKTIAILNLKGGTAKTVTAATMARCLAAEHDKQVVLIDADQQGNLSQYFGVTDTSSCGNTWTLLTDGAGYWPDFVTPAGPNLDLIPSGMELARADLPGSGAKVTRIEDLRMALSEDSVDFLIIDLPPSLGVAAQAALLAADEVIIPIRLDVFSTAGMAELTRQVDSMLQAGRWQTVRGSHANAKSIAYWISTLYSPFTSFSEIAEVFMKAKDGPELLQNFVNSWLAEPWEDTKLKTSAELVMERRTELAEFVLPEWTQLLTGGVDVQESSLYWVIRAWGVGMTSQNVAYGQALSFAEVVRVMNLEYAKASGKKMLVNLALVDSGEQTDEVYELCLVNSDWALPCKGVPAMQSHYRISTVNKAGSRANGMQLVLVDGGKYKDLIAARMRKPNGTGSWMVHRDTGLDYAEQVTAEHKISERSKGKAVQVWVPKMSHAANHYLDAEVYAAAAADLRGVRTLWPEEELPARPQPKPKAPPAETEWIPKNEHWI